MTERDSEMLQETQRLIEIALGEDLGTEGDITSQAILSGDPCTAVLLSKDAGVLAGTTVFGEVLGRVDGAVEVTFLREDGAELVYGDEVAHVRGPDASVLRAERTALNFIRFLSGIATATREYVRAAGETGGALILDTRKTLPGYRSLAKYAVRVGGGTNHRTGLYDMILIKNNHIDRAGSVEVAVRRCRERWGSRFRIEVECRHLEEVRQAVDQAVDVVMLDNMGIEKIREAVAFVGGRLKLEVSGGMDLDKVRAASAAGVDYISVGAITHSVRSFDFSLTVRGR